MTSALYRRGRCGFTLVELLVALAVMALLLTAILQITTGSLNTWRQAEARFQNFIIARSVMELMAGDFENAISGSNIGHAGALSTADELQFFTRRVGMDAPGGGVQRPLLFVSYAADEGSLLREERPYGWQDRGGFTATAPSPTELNSICDGVLAFRFAFPDGTGGFQRQIPADEAPRSVMLSLAILGQNAYERLQETGQLAAIEARLDSLAAANEGKAVEVWNDWLESATDIPADVRANLRFFQRVFPLPANSTEPRP